MLIAKCWVNLIRQPRRFLYIELLALISILLHLAVNPVGIERLQLAIVRFLQGNPPTFFRAEHPLQIDPVTIGDQLSKVTFFDLSQGKRASLADFSGKIVILELWASWCVPCQEPMRKLQTLSQQHPDWGDEVAIITVSMDQIPERAKNHLERNGWTQTYNVWAGPEKAANELKKKLETEMIPYVFVLDKDGRIEARGMPSQVNLAAAVERLLRFYR